MMAQNVRTMELTCDEKTMEHIKKLKDAWGVEDSGEAIRRAIEIADFLQHVADDGYDDLLAKSSARPDLPARRLEINHAGKFSLKITPTGR
jgi:hypothetical protein